MRASAIAEQLYDLERQVRALAEEVDEARRIIPELRARINDIHMRLGEGLRSYKMDRLVDIVTTILGESER